MTFYAGDEYADDEITSGPYDLELHDPEDFDDEYDRIEGERLKDWDHDR